MPPHGPVQWAPLVPVLEDWGVSEWFVFPEVHGEYVGKPVHLLLKDTEAMRKVYGSGRLCGSDG